MRNDSERKALSGLNCLLMCLFSNFPYRCVIFKQIKHETADRIDPIQEDKLFSLVCLVCAVAFYGGMINELKVSAHGKHVSLFRWIGVWDDSINRIIRDGMKVTWRRKGKKHTFDGELWLIDWFNVNTRMCFRLPWKLKLNTRKSSLDISHNGSSLKLSTYAVMCSSN